MNKIRIRKNMFFAEVGGIKQFVFFTYNRLLTNVK